jgi:hypothetical protein
LTDFEMSVCFINVLPFGALVDSVSDLLGLRLSLPLQSRPAQTSDGIYHSPEQLKLFHANIATVSFSRH